DGVDAKAPARDQARDDGAALGDEQPARGEQAMVADPAVIRDPWIAGGLDGDRQAGYCRTTDRRLRCASITCCPRRLLRNTFDSPLSIGCGTKRITSNWSWAS